MVAISQAKEPAQITSVGAGECMYLLILYNSLQALRPKLLFRYLLCVRWIKYKSHFTCVLKEKGKNGVQKTLPLGFSVTHTCSQLQRPVSEPAKLQGTRVTGAYGCGLRF